MRTWQVERSGRSRRLPSRLACVQCCTPMATGRRKRATRHQADSADPRVDFFGREEELGELRALLTRTRIVSLVGPPGVGKTRLAREFKEQSDAREDASRQVACADLSSVRLGRMTAELIRAAIARTFGARDRDQARSLQEILKAHGPTLLILDGCDHLTLQVDKCVEDLLEKVPSLKLLVVGRQRIRVSDEHVMELGPLDGSHSDADGVRMFIERARAAWPDFRPTDSERRAIADIVVALDGLPLAIELAASKVSIVGPGALRERLDRRFDVLRTSVRDGVPALSASIDASWQLLSPEERQLWAICSVFRGGFDLEAVEAVADAGSDADVLQLLAVLRERSLLHTQPVPSGAPRLDMYASLREFAERRLGGGYDVHKAHRRHAEHYLLEAERLLALGEPLALRWLRTEEQNVNVIIERGSQGSALEPEYALRAALVLSTLYGNDGSIARAESAIDEAIESVGSVEVDRGLMLRALSCRARIHVALGKMGLAAKDIETARAHVVGEGSAAEVCVLEAVGLQAFKSSQLDEALAAYSQARVLAIELGDARSISRVSDALGAVKMDLGLLTESGHHFEDARDAARNAGDVGLEATARAHLAGLSLEHGRLDRARDEYERAITLLREIEDRRSVAVQLANLGLVRVLLGELGSAEQALNEALEAHVANTDRPHFAIALGYLALCFEAGEDYVRALASSEQADVVHRESGNRLWAARQACSTARLLALSGDPEAAERTLVRTREVLEALDDRLGLELAELAEAHVLLANDHDLARQDGTPFVDEQVRRATQQFEAATAVQRRAHSGDRAWAIEQLRKSIAKLAPEHPTRRVLSVDRHFLWFQAPDTQRGDLRSRLPLQHLLGELVRARLDHPGLPVTRETLWEAAWPGERAVPRVASNRLHVAVYTLRKLGLRDILIGVTDGYYLNPDFAISLA